MAVVAHGWLLGLGGAVPGVGRAPVHAPCCGAAALRKSTTLTGPRPIFLGGLEGCGGRGRVLGDGPCGPLAYRTFKQIK